MAIYSMGVERISRGEGKSIVQAASWMSGETLHDERIGLQQKYPARPGLLHQEIRLPADSVATWALERSVLWNRVEASEKRKDANLGSRWHLALPMELNTAQTVALMRAFGQYLADFMNTAADCAVRRVSDVNVTGLVLIPARELHQDGFGEKTRFALHQSVRIKRGLAGSSRLDILLIRETWAALCNAALEEAGSFARIDHRSLHDRGIDLIPETKLGPIVKRRQALGETLDRQASSRERSLHNSEVLLKQPELVPMLIGERGEPLSRESLDRFVSRYVSDGDVIQSTVAVLSVQFFGEED